MRTSLTGSITGLMKVLPLQIVVIWCVLGLLSQTAWWRQGENKFFDELTVVTAPDEIIAPIVIVGIDQTSFAELQLQWPWPRGIHGYLTEQLHRAGAAVIAFDVVFADPSTPEQDVLFAQAIKNSGNVVLAADYIVDVDKRKQFERAIRVEPLPLFLEAGATSGIATLEPDGDTVVREIPSPENSFWYAIVRAWQASAAGSDAIAIPGRGARMRYLGVDHSFEYVSYYQAVDWQEKLPRNPFKDRIVLIGLDTHASPASGQSGTDTFTTPFLGKTGWMTPGVELWATIVANTLRGNSLLETPRFTPGLAILVSLLLVAPGMRRWHPAKSLLAAFAVMGLTLFTTVWLFKHYDTWLPALSVLAAPPLLYLVRGGSAYLLERRKRRQIRRTFEQYVAPAIVEEMIAKPELLKLGGTRRKLTLMFTDLAGFTSLSEKMEPEEVAGLLNRHLTAMTRIILQHGGTIDKFIGDAIMAFWGAPLEDRQQALHACQAAREMQLAMQRLREDFISEGLPRVHMRLGLHTGIAVVGNMGSHDRFDYSALGDSVNLAARLEGINKLYGTSILLSEATAKELDGAIQLLPVDRVRVKGKTQSIDIFTFEDNPALGPEVAKAIEAYRNCRWQEADSAWQQLMDDDATAGIARVYLGRIRRFQEQPPAADWDGSVALDKM